MKTIATVIPDGQLRASCRGSCSAHRVPHSWIQFAFTRVELLISLTVLALFAIVVLPALANNRTRSARTMCANNLRQIGMAFQLWGNNHNDKLPWETRYPGHPVAPDGGTKDHPLRANLWFQFSWISNELGTPRVLFCPSDTGRPADDFTLNPNGGYLDINYQNAATSYFLNTGGSFGSQIGVLAGDRNLMGDGYGSCSHSGIGMNTYISLQPVSGLGWSTNLHNEAGNLLRQDGTVNQYSNDELRAAAATLAPSYQPGLCILKPRP